MRLISFYIAKQRRDDNQDDFDLSSLHFISFSDHLTYATDDLNNKFTKN